MDQFPTLEKISNTVLRHVIRDFRRDAGDALAAFTLASFTGQSEEAEILLSAALVRVEEHEAEAQRRALPVTYWPKRRAILEALAQIQTLKHLQHGKTSSFNSRKGTLCTPVHAESAWISPASPRCDYPCPANTPGDNTARMVSH